jgi:hypothetical protein
VVTNGSAGVVSGVVSGFVSGVVSGVDSGVVRGFAARHHASMNATVVGEDLVELEIVRS